MREVKWLCKWLSASQILENDSILENCGISFWEMQSCSLNFFTPTWSEVVGLLNELWWEPMN